MGKSTDILPKLDKKQMFELNREFDMMDFSTRAIEVGNDTDRSAVPIYASVTSETFYQRHGDPSQNAVSRTIASLEGAKYTLVTSSGVSSIALPILGLINHGDRILCHYDIYIWAYFFIREDLPRIANVTVDMIDMTDLNSLEKELKKGDVKIVYIETIANPMMHVMDLKACTELAHRYGAKVIVDNTYVSPYLCRPLEYGCDIVCESLTKYMNGHGDAMGGSISTNDSDIYDTCVRMMAVLGPTISPFNAFLIMRGLQTLSIRMEKQCDNAEALVKYLKSKPFVTRIEYPMFDDHPQHELASRQLKRYGGMFGFLLDCDHDTLYNVILKELKLFKHMVSLGETHSLISPKDADPEKGIPADFIRISTGLECVDDLIADFENAFSKVWS